VCKAFFLLFSIATTFVLPASGKYAKVAVFLFLPQGNDFLMEMINVGPLIVFTGLRLVQRMDV
jgi:hypothetical protein